MPKSYKHLSVKERELIYEYKYVKHLRLREIGRLLNRNASTISNELKRNRNYFNGYRPYDAHCQSHSRQVKKKYPKIKLSRLIKNYINKTLKSFKISPVFICELVKEKFGVSFHHETIYRYIIKDKKEGGKLYEHLPRYKKRKRRLKAAHVKDPLSESKRRVEIRPENITNNTERGHLEIDLVIGSGKSVLLTMVDRKSKFFIVEKSPTKKMSEVQDAINRGLLQYNHPIKTITTDNGTEFFCYKELEKQHNFKFYFTNPYHSWEKGLIENSNGLIRTYLKKGSNFDNLNNELLKSVELLINITPRKSLDMKSPYIYTNKIKKSERGCKTFQLLDNIKDVFKKNNFKASIGWV